MIWDEFYKCESGVDSQCTCSNCPDDLLMGLGHTEISLKSKCKMIPRHMTHFCVELFKEVKAKFPDRSDSIVAEFLFDRWLLRALCDRGNQSGLIKNAFVINSLRQNLRLVKDAISSLLSSQVEFDISINLLPEPVIQVCTQRREQAKRFIKDFFTVA